MTMRALAVLISMIAGGNVSAEVVATCGASKGHAYYLPGPLVPASSAGWTDDLVSKGRFQLIRSGEDWDIVFTDASGGTLSARGDGGTIVAFVTEDGDVVVSILYDLTWETYVFWLSQAKPLASYSQAKFAAPIRKHAVLIASCRRGA